MMHIFLDLVLVFQSTLIYNMYGSIRIEEINTVNSFLDRYLNYDGKVKMIITQELKT